MPGGVILGFQLGYLLFQEFFLFCFALVSIYLRGFLCFLGVVFVPGFVCFEPLGSSFVSQGLFVASLLLCSFSALLLSFDRFLILCALFYDFPISYLSLRFQCF